jgi:hypothetical protein
MYAGLSVIGLSLLHYHLWRARPVAPAGAFLSDDVKVSS